MAKLDRAGTLAQTRGKQGGIVVSSNASAAYVRPWAMPRRPRTYEQWLSANRFREAAQRWSEVSAEDKATWSAEAADPLWQRQDWFGQAYQPSGLNLYIMVWMWYWRLGGYTVPPVPSGALPVATLGITVETSGAWTTYADNNILISTTQAPSGSYRYLLFDADLRRGKGSQDMHGNYRPHTQWDLNTGATKTLYGGNAGEGSGYFRDLIMVWRATFLTEDLKAAAPIYGTYRSPTT